MIYLFGFTSCAIYLLYLSFSVYVCMFWHFFYTSKFDNKNNRTDEKKTSRVLCQSICVKQVFPSPTVQSKVLTMPQCPSYLCFRRFYIDVCVCVLIFFFSQLYHCLFFRCWTIWVVRERYTYPSFSIVIVFIVLYYMWQFTVQLIVNLNYFLEKLLTVAFACWFIIYHYRKKRETEKQVTSFWAHPTHTHSKR